MAYISHKIVQSQLRCRLIKAESELGLRYFLRRINAIVAEKGLKQLSWHQVDVKKIYIFIAP